MKVTNWRKKLAAAIVAAGISVPGVAQAVNIPISDADFEAYDATPHGGFAYAVAGGGGGTYTGAYRPTSPWVDDLDHVTSPYIQDNQSSNYLYDAAYSNASNRGAPHSLDSAMHGLARYSAQNNIGAVFEADTTYTLSVWAQDDLANSFTKGVFMYLFDGSSAFSDSTALASILHPGTAINDRAAGMSEADSRNNWTPLTLPAFTPTGGMIGKPIGVGFFVRRGTAIDDVALTATAVPEPTSIILVGLSGLTVLGLRRKR